MLHLSPTMPSIDQISRTAAADEDGGDHIGYETPRSGVATPQPDLQDKRLPGIMSYFGQVRLDPLATQLSSATFDPEAPSPCQPHNMEKHSSSACLPLQYPNEGALPNGDSLACCHPGPGDRGQQQDSESNGPRSSSHLFPPTPPASQPPSSGGSFREERREATHRETTAASEVAPADSSLPIRSPEESSKRSLPQSSSSPDAPPPPSKSKSQDDAEEKPAPPASSGKWFSLDGLKGLTRVVFKSGPPTPTRALSTAQSSHSEGRDSSLRISNDGAETSGTQTPRVPAGAQAPTPKGKLTIKIPEARGLRKCRDPYVVVVFQRSELISGGPRQFEDHETLNIPPPPGRGGIAIQRQGSDSGRPPMSIPMRSRQSSNTSISAEHSSFRNRPARLSFTNPQWDAEAVL
jgi:serine/threonine protein kinase SCH9